MLGIVKAFSFLAHQRLCRHAAVFQDYLCHSGTTMTCGVENLANREPRRIGIDEERGNPLVGPRKEEKMVGLRRVGNEDLAAVEDIVIPFALGFGGKCAGIRPSVRLSQSK